jgi:hypothetical protein
MWRAATTSDPTMREVPFAGLRGAWPRNVFAAVALVACADNADLHACDGLALDAPPRTRPLASVTRCNGDAALCDRRYDQVVYATAHNAMSNADDGWYVPNQRHSISRALDDGVRALMLDTHDYRGDAYLCHGDCRLGRRPLADAMCAVRAFLDAHPDEVVTLLFESAISADDTVAAIARGGLSRYVGAQPEGGRWPTLRAMIAAGHRLVVFTETGGRSPSWYLPLYDLAWETDYSFRDPAEMSCAGHRGDARNALFVLNHFLSDPVASPELADVVNHAPLLLARARRCMAETRHLPNFVAVDFYDVGDLFAVVDTLNGSPP